MAINRLMKPDFRKAASWQNASPIPGYDPALWRMDCDGRVIKWSDYGIKSDHGWEIDHIVPVALGGGDDVSNLRARHWMGNSSAGGTLSNMLRRGN